MVSLSHHFLSYMSTILASELHYLVLCSYLIFCLYLFSQLFLTAYFFSIHISSYPQVFFGFMFKIKKKNKHIFFCFAFLILTVTTVTGAKTGVQSQFSIGQKPNMYKLLKRFLQDTMLCILPRVMLQRRPWGQPAARVAGSNHICLPQVWRTTNVMTRITLRQAPPATQKRESLVVTSALKLLLMRVI